MMTEPSHKIWKIGTSVSSPMICVTLMCCESFSTRLLSFVSGVYVFGQILCDEVEVRELLVHQQLFLLHLDDAHELSRASREPLA